MQLTHLGQSCLLIEDGGARVLIDPGVLSPGAEELTELDAVLATHGHADHLDVERLPVLLDGNPTAGLVTEPQTAVELTRVGLSAHPLHPGETTTVAGFEVTAVGGWHGSVHPELPPVPNIGFLLRGPSGTTLFHPGDALDALPPQQPAIDGLALPISGSWLRLGEAVEFARAVGAHAVVPVHDGPLSPYGRRVAWAWLRRLLPMPVLEPTEPFELPERAALG